MTEEKTNKQSHSGVVFPSCTVEHRGPLPKKNKRKLPIIMGRTRFPKYFFKFQIIRGKNTKEKGKDQQLQICRDLQGTTSLSSQRQ